MTDQQAHTPGPWRANLHHTQRSGGRTYAFVNAGDIVPLAAVTLGVEGMPEQEGRANAILIAAAPELKDSAAEIQRLTLVIESAVRNADPKNYPAVLAALKANRAAIVKTEGASPHTETGATR